MLTGNPPAAKFPSPVYAETVLSENFRDFQRLFLNSLIDLHYAHTLMLRRQGILSAAAAISCLNALDTLNREHLRTMPYNGSFEDLFFAVQHEIERAAGEDYGGRMHTARSRNDIALTLYRMCLRREVLTIAGEVHNVNETLLSLARRHIHTLIPAYTHTQPAQPSTLAHYLLAAIECFQRDQVRLQAAFATINRSPLGACAITTTGFPIDRNYTAELLGFEGLQLNSYGAIAATDYVTETAGAIATAMVNLGKLVQDLLLWCNPALGFLHLSPAWIQTSSIMPQKRNPVALEHTRILASKSLAQSQAIFTATHNTPFGDIVDSEDDLQPLVFAMTTDTRRALRLFAGLMSDCQFDTQRLASHANADFLTVTELADTLTRRENISFTAAHSIVSKAVDQLDWNYSPDRMVDAVITQLKPPVNVTRADLLEALDPSHFVKIRRIAGGPAPEPIEAALALAAEAQQNASNWILARQTRLADYPKKIKNEKNQSQERSD